VNIGLLLENTLLFESGKKIRKTRNLALLSHDKRGTRISSSQATIIASKVDKAKCTLRVKMTY